MANLITVFRILVSAALLFCPVFSPVFCVLYLAAGFSDMIDGAVARKTGTASGFGADLDAVADFVFVAVCLIRMLPIMNIPVWLYVWIGMIALIKGINIASGYVMWKKFVSLHTAANKITGVMLFALPLTIPVFDPRYASVAVCMTATFAAIQEGHLIRRGDHDLQMEPGLR